MRDLTVLLVQEDDIVRGVLSSALEIDNSNVLAYASVADAVRLLNVDTTVHVVVIDVVSYLSYAAEGREPAMLRGCPVVVLALGGPGERPSGATAFLGAPLDVDEVLATVRFVARQSQ